MEMMTDEITDDPLAGLTGWPRQNEYRKIKAREMRAALVSLLGGKCVECETVESLEFDHLVPRTWVVRKLNALQRMRVYWREAEAGHIVLRCRSCNARKGAPIDPDVPEITGLEDFPEDGLGWDQQEAG